MPISGPPLDAPADLPGLLDLGLAADPDGVALVSRERQLTWAQLEAASIRYASHLLDLGLKTGDRVASLMPNRTALIVHYLACMKAALVATPLNYRYRPAEMDHALSVSGASAILAHAERREDLAASAEVAKLRIEPIMYGDAAGSGPRLEELLETEPTPRELAKPDPDVPAFIFFTSGSTGPPKGVTHTQRTYGWIAASLAAALELTSDDVAMPGSSMSHIGSPSWPSARCRSVPP